jgi:mannitol/fructose-specific phosphotransferase system IIA component
MSKRSLKRKGTFFAFAGLCLLFIALGSEYAWCAAVEQRMEIRDLSDKGSPIQISGHMTLGYDSANQFPFSYQESLSIKNVSAKSILLMVVHLEATSGPGSDETFSQEYFFGDPLAPEQVEAHDFPEQRFGTTLVNGEPMPYKPDPRPAAQAHAEFVQFSDGSTWGDEDSAQNALGIRRQTMGELDLLEHVYEQAGESAFLDELAKADEFLNVISQLKSRCSDKAMYTSCTHKGVHQTFVTAKEHEAALNSGIAGANAN